MDDGPNPWVGQTADSVQQYKNDKSDPSRIADFLGSILSRRIRSGSGGRSTEDGNEGNRATRIAHSDDFLQVLCCIGAQGAYGASKDD